MRTVNWSGRAALYASLALAALVFFAGLLLVVAAWLILEALGFTTSLWAMLEALATAGAAALVFGGGIVAYRQLAEMTSSRHLEVADRLFEELNSPANVAARRWVYQNLSGDPAAVVPSLSREGQDAIKQVLNSLDRVAFLTQPGWIPEAMVMPWMSVMVVKSWAKLKPYVEYERARRNEPGYYHYAQTIAERCLSWREAHGGDTPLVWVKDAL